MKEETFFLPKSRIEPTPIGCQIRIDPFCQTLSYKLMIGKQSNYNQSYKAISKNLFCLLHSRFVNFSADLLIFQKLRYTILKTPTFAYY
jgi:hypothetical protein